MSIRRRNALALVVAALIGAAVIGTVTWRVTETNQPAANGVGTTAHPDNPTILRARAHRGWVAEANFVCGLGRKRYPSIALGAEADPDTMDYAVHRLLGEIASIVDAPANPVRVRLARAGRAAASALFSLATLPIGEVTEHERQEAERLTAGYVDELVAAGAGACAPLRPTGV
jgi:hypothetical protein